MFEVLLEFCFFRPKEVRKVFFPGFESAHCGTREMGEAALTSAGLGRGVTRLSYIFTLSQLFFHNTEGRRRRKKLSRAQVWNEYRAFLCACVSVCVREQESPANKYIVSACINCFHNHLKYKSFACPETDLMSRREKEEEKKRRRN